MSHSCNGRHGSHRRLKQRIRQVTRCKRSEVPKFIGDAHVAIPMMSRLDADLLRRGEQLRLILQFGVGVEGIDIPAVGNMHRLIVSRLLPCQDHSYQNGCCLIVEKLVHSRLHMHAASKQLFMTGCMQNICSAP